MIQQVSAVGKVFSDSFVNSRNITHDKIKEMIKAWVSIENDPDVINAVIDNEIEELGKIAEIQDIIIESDSEEENDDLDNGVEMQHIVAPDEVSGALDCLNELPDECSKRGIYRF